MIGNFLMSVYENIFGKKAQLTPEQFPNGAQVQKPNQNSADPTVQPLQPLDDQQPVTPAPDGISPQPQQLTGAPAVQLTPDGPQPQQSPAMAPMPPPESVQTVVPPSQEGPQNVGTMDIDEIDRMHPLFSKNLRKFGVLTVDRAVFMEMQKLLIREAALKRMSVSEYLNAKR
jgi:hypothetical protein